MNAVMYIFANRGLDMSPGKLAAQVAHAAVEAYRISNPELVKAWYSGGHHTKLVMLAEDETQIANIREYLNDRGFASSVIIDEGRTEIRPFSKTALGVEIVDKDDEHVVDTFSSFKVYKEQGYKVRSLADIPVRDAVMRTPMKYLSRAGKKYLKTLL